MNLLPRLDQPFAFATGVGVLSLVTAFGNIASAQRPLANKIELVNEQRTNVAKEPVVTLELSPDNRTLLAGSETGFYLMRTADLKPICLHRAVGGNVVDAAFSPDSRYVATVGNSKVLQFWDARSGRRNGEAKDQSWYMAVEAHKTKNECVSGGVKPTLYRWDMASGRKLAELATPHQWIQQICMHPDGKHIIVVSHPGGSERAHVVELRDFDTLQVRATLAKGDRHITAIAASPNKQLIAWTTGTGHLKVCSANNMRVPTEFKLEQENVRDLRFLPDSQHLFVGGWGRFLTIVDTANGQARKYEGIPPKGGITSLALLHGSEQLGIGAAKKPSRLVVGIGSTALNYRLSVWDIAIDSTKTAKRDPAVAPTPTAPAMPAATDKVAPSTHLAVPAADAIKGMVDQLRDLLDIDGSVDKTAAKSLSNKLSAIAAEDDDPIVKYAALQEAMRLAGIAGDRTAAQNAIDLMDLNFEIDRMKITGSFIRRVSPRGLTKTQLAQWGEWADRLGDDALNQEQPPYAIAFYDIALRMTASGEDQETRASIQKKRDRVRRYLPEFSVADPLRRKLASNPDDPQACLGWGRYLCFVRGNWKDGLPLIAKGSDQELSALASEDLQTTKGPKESQAIAAKWISLADRTEDKVVKRGAIEAARFWLTQASANLTGLSLLTVQKQLKELPPKSEIVRIP